eukprot:749230-Hanusia_phi.AAC.4
MVWRMFRYMLVFSNATVRYHPGPVRTILTPTPVRIIEGDQNIPVPPHPTSMSTPASTSTLPLKVDFGNLGIQPSQA